MARNQASMVRRQRERARQQKRREKQAKRAERRELKKEQDDTETVTDNPMKDPTIDWSAAVRQIKVDESDFPIPELGETADEA
jgi:hypothetical protein